MEPKKLDPQVLRLAARGFRLFPCKERAKEPAIAKWQRLASTDTGQLQSWSQRFSGCNWGLATGPGSGVFVLDVDGQPGLSAFWELSGHDRWLSTLGVRTIRGSHLYFQWPTEGTVKNSAGKLGIGLDIRGLNGYVVTPPSVHPSGTQYTWLVNEEIPISTAPDWLAKAVTS
jgi:hypothetical protein